MADAPVYLAADIGGTNARFAIARGSAETGFELVHVRRCKLADHAGPAEALAAFLDSWDGPAPTRACLAVAGPVGEGEVRLTNASWRFEPSALKRAFGFETLAAVNDFAAQARGAPLCPPAEQRLIADGTAAPGAPIAVLGPGTGLGLGLLVPHEGGVSVVATEGGHAGFAPRTEGDMQIARFIAAEHGFVSWEHVLSGPGLVLIHRALCAEDRLPDPDMPAEAITAQALAEPGSTARRTVLAFLAMLGAYAGDVAVMTGARGGLYIAGGIVPKLAGLIDDSAFEARRVARGAMSEYVRAIPVSLVLSDAAPLMGAAAIAEGA
ncbi:MAG: glucokinase [Oceanicaulis sp.]